MENTPRFRPARDLNQIHNLGSPWLPSLTHFVDILFGKILLPVLGCRLNKGVFLMLVMLSLPIG